MIGATHWVAMDISDYQWPAPGSTVYSQLSISKQQLLNIVSDADKSEVALLLTNAANINISAEIEIYDGKTGIPLDTIGNKADVLQIATKYGFSSQDILDMQDYWQQHIAKAVPQKTFIIGANWDIPGLVHVDYDITYRTTNYELTEVAAHALAAGKKCHNSRWGCGASSQRSVRGNNLRSGKYCTKPYR